MKKFLLFIFVCFLSNTGLIAQNIIIDDFSTNQLVAITAMGPLERSQSIAGGGILGGERDAIYAKTNSTTQTGEIVIGNNILGVNNPVGGLSFTRLIYDGNDGDPDVINPTGLGGVNLLATGNAFDLEVQSIDVPNTELILTITVYTDAGNISQRVVTLDADNYPPTITETFPFASFSSTAGSGADFTNVGAIELRIESIGLANISIDAVYGPFRTSGLATIVTAPIPTMSQWSLLIFGLLVLNMGVFFVQLREIA